MIIAEVQRAEKLFGRWMLMAVTNHWGYAFGSFGRGRIPMKKGIKVDADAMHVLPYGHTEMHSSRRIHLYACECFCIILHLCMLKIIPFSTEWQKSSMDIHTVHRCVD